MPPQTYGYALGPAAPPPTTNAPPAEENCADRSLSLLPYATQIMLRTKYTSQGMGGCLPYLFPYQESDNRLECCEPTSNGRPSRLGTRTVLKGTSEPESLLYTDVNNHHRPRRRTYQVIRWRGPALGGPVSVISTFSRLRAHLTPSHPLKRLCPRS